MKDAASVVVLGDMRDLHHHGCEAVMAQLLGGLAENKMAATAVLAGLEWQPHADLCLRADLVIINGEGALHHNRPVIDEVLRLAEIRRAASLPTALVNSSWFANDPVLTRRLAAFDLVSLRDPASRREAVGVSVIAAPDLAIREALARRSTAAPVTDGTFMVSDSTRPELTRELRNLARQRHWRYLPVLYPPAQPRPGAKSRKIWRKLKLARALGPLAARIMSPRYHAHLMGVPDLASYCQALASSRGVVTGRFHTACLCAGLGVPFVAVASNTPKIEALIEAAGLDHSRRLVTRGELSGLAQVLPYSLDERRALDGFLQNAETWYEHVGIILLCIAIPMVLHGFYDTLLKKDYPGFALAVVWPD